MTTESLIPKRLQRLGQFKSKGPAYGSKRPEGRAYPVPLIHTPAIEAKIRLTCNEVARQQGFKGEISYRKDTYTFKIGDRAFVAGGLADLKNKKISIFVKYVEDAKAAAGIMAHEVEHIKFQRALDAYSAERKAIFAKYYDGKSKEEQYKFWREILSATDDLIEGDGVSEYSFEYWKAFKAEQVSFDIAVHETLAEIARLNEGELAVEHMGPQIISYRSGGLDKPPSDRDKKRVAKVWADLFRDVDRVNRLLDKRT